MPQTFLSPEFEAIESDKPVNVSSVPQHSPFRYPGGKTWLVPLFRRWMFNFATEPKRLIEPFAGGGIISLTAAFEQLADEVVMVELDRQIAAVWKTILDGEAAWLAKRILTFELTLETARAELSKSPKLERDLAFQTIVKNRTSHGGILANGAGLLKHGDGKGVLSRWYPQTIAQRISDIEFISHRLHFVHGDAFEIIAKHGKEPNTVFFIDPPYTAGGKRAGSRLYTHSEVDHEKLFSLCENLKGDFLMTYDNAEEVQALAKHHGFQTRAVAMKNTHHAEMTELLVGRDLDWVDEGGMFYEKAETLQHEQPKQVSYRKRTIAPKRIKKLSSPALRD